MAFRPDTGRRHVIIVGAGFAGVFAARELKNADVDVTLIDRENHHLFSPLLYQVATGLLSPGDIAPANRQILDDLDNLYIVKGEVKDINVDEQTVTADIGPSRRDFEYDDLILASGGNQSYFGNDHFAQYAPGLKTLDDALEIRGRFIDAFERAELTDDPEERQKLLNFVIIGAGPTGVELAGQLSEMAHRTLSGEFRNINPDNVKIYLLDGAPQVLPPFGKKLGRKAQRMLEKLGIEVRLNAMVSNVDATSVSYKTKDGDEVTLESYTKVWSAGVSASSLGARIAEQVGIDPDRGGKIPVNEDLTVGDKDNVFIVGDVMSRDKLPGVAQVAIQSGVYAAQQIAKRAEGEDPKDREPFSYYDKGSMAIISRFKAVAKIGDSELAGLVPWFMWLGVHLWYMSGRRSRFNALVTWVSNIFSRRRGELTTTRQQVVGRTGLDKLAEEKPEEFEAIYSRKNK